MTPLLRAGLGGLATALLWLNRRGASGPLQGEVSVHSVLLRWGPEGPEPALKGLFEQSFALGDSPAIIRLPAVEGSTAPRLEVAVGLQDALRQTLLQHGKHASKAGEPQRLTVEVDQTQAILSVQSYADYAHRSAWREIAEALGRPGSPTIQLAGWASPGAVHRHVAIASSAAEYTPAQALCACFALVGTLSLRTQRGGALIVPVPADLLAFARARHHLTPRALADLTVGGAGDAILAAQVALRADQVADEAQGAVSGWLAMLTRPTAWASQQKSRVQVLECGSLPEDRLNAYHELVSLLPSRVHVTRGKGDAPGEVFTTPSLFRAFVAENLAQGRPWFQGFALATDPSDPARRLHRPWEPKNNGALQLREKEGVRRMIEHLDEAERALVEAVQTALRQRFGQIAEQYKDNAVGRNNRFERERERVRLAFAGARTHEQIRFALADLWSRAGTNPTLQRQWEQVLPLLRADRWQAARDLSLVALAAYRGRADEPDEQPTTDNPS